MDEKQTFEKLVDLGEALDACLDAYKQLQQIDVLTAQDLLEDRLALHYCFSKISDKITPALQPVLQVILDKFQRLEELIVNLTVPTAKN